MIRDPNFVNKITQSIKWSYIATIVQSILRIFFIAVLARLLEPATFGLIAIVNAVLELFNYFVQIGTGHAIIQKEKLSTEDIRAAFTLSLLYGIFAFAVIWMAAPLVTLLLNDPQIVYVLRIMSTILLFTGFASTSLSLLTRSLNFRYIAIIHIISHIIGYGILGIILAFNGFGVWSIVAATVATAAISSIMAYALTKHNLMPLIKLNYIKPIFLFGFKVSSINLLELFGSKLDTFIIGRLIGAASLGIYNRAFMLVYFPIHRFTISLSRVLLPSFSKMQLDFKRLKDAYVSSIIIYLALVIPACAGIVVAAEEIILVILGSRWIAAIPILRILAIAIPLNLFCYINKAICESMAYLKNIFILQLGYITLLVILFTLLKGFGLIGFAVAVTLGAIFLNGGYFYLIKKILKINYSRIFATYYPGILNGAIVFCALFFASSLLRNMETRVWIIFIIQLLLGFLLLLFLTFITPSRLLKREIERYISLLYSTEKEAIPKNGLLGWYYEYLKTLS
ncbi:MAG: lipopolysaccharide biosynthesis protein [Candidatus Omnitrophica bacterium]|nr:lipopolysaccharide biosynthesis protein [Candidatus Omnitrophota bacterium]